MSVHQRITTSFNDTKSKFFCFFTFLRCTYFLMFLDYKFRYPNIYLYINCFTWNHCQITWLKVPPFHAAFVNKSWSATEKNVKLFHFSTITRLMDDNNRLIHNFHLNSKRYFFKLCPKIQFLQIFFTRDFFLLPISSMRLII